MNPGKVNAGIVSYFVGRLMKWGGIYIQMGTFAKVMGVDFSWWWAVALGTLPFVMYADWRWMTPQELIYLRKKGGYAGRDDK